MNRTRSVWDQIIETIATLRIVAAWKLWPKRHGCVSMTAGRLTFAVRTDTAEYVLALRVRETPIAYSREEVMALALVVRREEARMGWRCPEPTPTIPPTKLRDMPIVVV